MTDDRTRRAILARRARFLAAALTTLPATACDKDKAPIGPDDAGHATTATPTATTEDAGPRDATGTTDARPDAPRPTVCLRMVMHRDGGPGSCLSY